MKTEITVYGARKIEADLTALGVRAEELEPVWESLHSDLLLIEQEQFDTEGAHGESGPWTPLASSTMRTKQYRTGNADVILQATERLIQSLTTEGTNHIWSADQTGWVFGSNVAYGVYHKTGTGKMPSRPPISLTREERAAILVKIKTYIRTGVVAPL